MFNAIFSLHYQPNSTPRHTLLHHIFARYLWFAIALFITVPCLAEEIPVPLQMQTTNFQNFRTNSHAKVDAGWTNDPIYCNKDTKGRIFLKLMGKVNLLTWDISHGATQFGALYLKGNIDNYYYVKSTDMNSYNPTQQDSSSTSLSTISSALGFELGDDSSFNVNMYGGYAIRMDPTVDQRYHKSYGYFGISGGF